MGLFDIFANKTENRSVITEEIEKKYADVDYDLEAAELLYNLIEKGKEIEKKHLNMNGGGPDPLLAESLESMMRTGLPYPSIDYDLNPKRMDKIVSQLKEYGFLNENGKLVSYDNRWLLECLRKVSEDSEHLQSEHNDKTQNINELNGYEFEEYCASVLNEQGYNTQVTSKSGDFGVDVIAEKGEMRFAIQCKCHSNPVGIDAIQQVFSGKSYYHCDVAVVISTAGYTQQAIQLANELSVKLWGVEELNNHANAFSSIVSNEDSSMRRCPYCDVEISYRVKRCPNCNSILN